MKLVVLALLLTAAPAGAHPAAPTAPVISTDGRLFAEFGGRDGLVRIVDDLFVNVDADPRINTFFEPAKREQTKAHLVEQFCVVLGGGCTYTGKDMKAAHKDLGVQKADVFALIENLQKAMDKNGVPFSAQNKLLAALAPQHRDIVETPAN
jgi:hemoglobin